jgi:transposase
MSGMADQKPRRTRRSFTDDYRAGAVRLVLDEGKTVAAAARDLGLTESSLRNWVEQARADRTHGKTGLTTAEREELLHEAGADLHRCRHRSEAQFHDRHVNRAGVCGDRGKARRIPALRLLSLAPRSRQPRRSLSGWGNSGLL